MRLATHFHSEVRHSVFLRKDLTPQILQIFIDESPRCWAAAALHACASKEQLVDIFQRGTVIDKVCVLKNPAAPSELLVEVIEDLTGPLRVVATENPNVPYPFLLGLLGDPNPWVKQAAATAIASRQ
jgi:hypothetical protein